MKKFMVFCLIACLSVSALWGCSSKPGEAGDNSEISAPINNSHPETEMGESEAIDDVDDTEAGSEIEQKPGEEGASSLTEDQLNALYAVMESLAAVAPGSAGSGMRQYSASARILDFAELYVDDISESALAAAVNEWIDNKANENSDIRQNLEEAWVGVSEIIPEMAKSPMDYYNELSDSGYELKNSSYSTAFVAKVCSCIERGIKN